MVGPTRSGINQDLMEQDFVATPIEHTRSQQPPTLEATVPSAPANSSTDIQSAVVNMDNDAQMMNGSSALPEIPGAMETLGSHSRDLIQLIQKLETLGISSTLPSLPKFVVVGDQSAGKSSVIEALCDISLPRSQGTCTKCPYQITTTCSIEDSDWSCTVTLHRKFEYTPGTKAGNDITRYDNWTETDSLNAFEFAIVHNKADLEEVLWRAQLAILDPKRNPAEFLRMLLPASNPQLVFSPNTVSVHITGQGLPELSFFDLPGAINVHEDASQQHQVPFIERLIKNHVQDEKALVLLTVACDQDMETSTTFRFVQGDVLKRCMGVLTKPDLLAHTEKRLVYLDRLLKGEIFQLRYGWFVTKSLSQAELDDKVTHAGARMREQNFFANQEPWCSLPASFSSRLGIPKLQDAVSQKLTQHIVNNLDEIMSRVEARLIEVTKQLDGIPEQAKEPSLSVMNEIDNLSAVVIKELKSGGGDNFRYQYKDAIQKLRGRLMELRPQVNLTTPGFKQPAIDVSSEDEDAAITKSAKLRKGIDGRAIPVRTGRAAQTPRVKTGDARTSHFESKIAAPPIEPKVFTLDELRKMYEQGSGSGVPDQTDPNVTENIILKSLQGWREQVHNTLQAIQVLLEQMLIRVLDGALAARKHTKLYFEAKRVVELVFAEHMHRQSNLVYNIVACETHKPVTNAVTTLKEQKQTEKEELLNDRKATRINEYYDVQDAKTGKTTKPEERKKKATDDWIKSALGNDRYTREVEAMGPPFAYYDIAFSRMVDTIDNHLQFGLIYKIQEQVQTTLRDGLDVCNSEHCAQLLAEDREREELRRRLVVEKTKLEQAVEELRGLSPRN